jgi:hypothetical protein
VLQKMVINKIISLLSKQFKLHKIMKYVEEPNDADDRIDKLETTVFQQGRLIEFILNEKKSLNNNKEK